MHATQKHGSPWTCPLTSFNASYVGLLPVRRLSSRCADADAGAGAGAGTGAGAGAGAGERVTDGDDAEPAPTAAVRPWFSNVRPPSDRRFWRARRIAVAHSALSCKLLNASRVVCTAWPGRWCWIPITRSGLTDAGAARSKTPTTEVARLPAALVMAVDGVGLPAAAATGCCAPNSGLSPSNTCTMSDRSTDSVGGFSRLS